MPDPMSEQQVEERWTIYRVRIGERGVGEWQVAGTQEAQRGVKTAHHTDVVEVVPESRVQELEGERDRFKAHIRSAITAYATDGSSAEDALLDIENAL